MVHEVAQVSESTRAAGSTPDEAARRVARPRAELETRRTSRGEPSLDVMEADATDHGAHAGAGSETDTNSDRRPRQWSSGIEPIASRSSHPRSIAGVAGDAGQSSVQLSGSSRQLGKVKSPVVSGARLLRA